MIYLHNIVHITKVSGRKLLILKLKLVTLSNLCENQYAYNDLYSFSNIMLFHTFFCPWAIPNISNQSISIIVFGYKSINVLFGAQYMHLTLLATIFQLPL